MDMELVNPAIDSSLNYWAIDTDILPPAVNNRNTILEQYRDWFDGNFTYRNRLEDIPDTYPLTNVNWYATAAHSYAAMLNSTPPEVDDEIAFDIYSAMYSAFVDYFMYGVGLITAFNDSRGRLRVVSIDPRYYWRDDDDNQFFAYHRNNNNVILGAWDAEGRRYGVREARLSSDKIASISAPSVENVDDELYDAVIAFTRSPSYGMSDVGTSMFPILKPLVEEISAIDTRNSYMSAYHGMPLFAYFTNNLTPDTRKIANKGDMIAGHMV